MKGMTAMTLRPRLSSLACAALLAIAALALPQAGRAQEFAPAQRERDREASCTNI